jgi:hypothetical protein
MSCDPVRKVRLLYGNYSTGLLFLYPTALRIMEKYGTRAVIKFTPELVRVTTLLVLRANCGVLLAVHIDAVVELLTVHPYAL